MKDKCTNIATVQRFWPGKEPDLVCTAHANDSKCVADAMGVAVVFEPIGFIPDGIIPDQFPTCCCSAGFSQKVKVKLA